MSTCRHIFQLLFSGADRENLKWAASQEAVTFPWLSAHSIRTGIGGDTSIVAPPVGLSRANFPCPWAPIWKKSAPVVLGIIDTSLATVYVN
ncbi:hypothetical protein SBA7_30041 [Candidatus Sulfotelmatobacter sp. SbA7]|nr:hypothetical protein SBA7_30041 [Candidatus Sulfotelmatobacter sp. SbA7]